MNDIPNIRTLWPVLGISVFAVLYFIASFSYPGGSQFEKDSIGFSWFHNYWCNLLNPIAINGKINHARPIAMMAHIVLCISIWYFFWSVVPCLLSGTQKLYLQIVSSISCFISLLLMTNLNHNIVANMGAFLSVISLIITMKGLWHHHLIAYFYTGLINFFIVAVNTILYYHHEMIYYLPFVQKISFAYFLIWVCGISLVMYKRKIKTQTTYL